MGYWVCVGLSQCRQSCRWGCGGGKVIVVGGCCWLVVGGGAGCS